MKNRSSRIAPVSIIIIIVIVVLACSRNFDKEVWLDNPALEDTKNPRGRMIKDVITNHLKVGMTKEEVIDLLGPPFFDDVQQSLFEGTTIPDSLTNFDYSKTKEERSRHTENFNAWLRSQPKQPDTILMYAAGWSIMDPNSLTIYFNEKGQVRKFYVAQH